MCGTLICSDWKVTQIMEHAHPQIIDPFFSHTGSSLYVWCVIRKIDHYLATSQKKNRTVECVFGGCGLSDFIFAKNDKNISRRLVYTCYCCSIVRWWRMFLTARECWWHVSLLDWVVAFVDATHSFAHHELGGRIVPAKWVATLEDWR